MDRRTACLTVAALAVGLARPARAQTARLARVAWVSMDRADSDSPPFSAFRAGMREYGWTEGQRVTIDTWWADGSVERLRALVPEILASRPDVIVAASGPAVRQLIEAQVTPPMIFAFSADVVLGKIVHSWTRPGVNRTGVSFFSLDLVPKRLEIMKEAFPGMKRVALVGWPPHAGEVLELDAATLAADRLGLQHNYFGASNAAELDKAFDAITRWNADALLAFAGSVVATQPDRFAAFSRRRRMPTVSAWAAFAERGNVMTYGPVLRESYTRLASYVDRVLRGAKPADLAVGLPSKFELVINMNAAREIGVTIPQSVLVRAERVIE